MSEKKESYFGWVVVAASCLMMAAVYAPNTSVAGLFMLPMATDFGINITESTLQITIGILAGAISASFVGKLMGKFGVTRVMSIALAFYGLSLLGAAYLSNSIYVVYIFTAMKGLAFPATTMIPVSIMINTWFGPKLTGRAMGISMAGFGIGGMILNPITSYIIENWGWRHGYGLFGVLALLMIPISIIVTRPTPESKGQVLRGTIENADPIRQNGFTTSQALKTPLFWVVMFTFFLLSGISQAWNNSGPTYMGVIGFTGGNIGNVMLFSAMGGMIGLIAFGGVIDKWGSKMGARIGGCMAIVGYILAVFSSTSVLLAALSSFLIGAGGSICVLLLNCWAGEMFGNKEFGSFVGYMTTCMYLGLSSLPLIVTVLFDRTNEFSYGWYTCAGLGVIFILLLPVCFALRKRAFQKIAVDSKSI